ncbi:apolipoprotein Bb, tandem duplicate 1 [Hoplias malabaricus]|uniref:apolipoprotein Bb, tandem duplicate 1 n=1 Tax=Hoplias malabaricus TaxID=27720 RepID=UPI003463500A
MGDNKLYLFLVLSIVVLTNAQDEGPCLLAKRFRSFHTYKYLYEAESFNDLNGAHSGPRFSCKVEIDVPGTCHFIVRTKECTLSEIVDSDVNGHPIFKTAAGADTFKTEMEKNPLKVTVEGDNDIKLFPEDGELTNILNIKRGIISALAVPVLEEERNKRMPTVFGLCKTDYTFNAREDIATDVTLTRDLSRCNHFRPIKDHTSPLAIITGMHYPLAQLFRSKQTCNYIFDNQQKHMTSGVCTDNHLLVPFSYKGTHGVTNVGKQTMTLLGVTKYNERVFDHNAANMKPLHLDASVDMSPIQDANVILTILRELADLSQTTEGFKRAHLAQKLVAVIRKSNTDTLSAALPRALQISRPLTYQALFQCGTPECSSSMMKVLRAMGSTTAEIDALVYAMGLVPNPSRVLVKEMLEMAKFKPSKLIYYATSNAVRRLYKSEGKVTPEITAVADYVDEEIGDCKGDQEHIYLTLRVTGNMAAALGAASPALKTAVIKCINEPTASPEVQQAAIQVFRLTPVPEEGRSVLLQVLLDRNAPVQKRIAAYLILMKDPQPAELSQLTAALSSEKNLQAKSFFISHITNILSSTAPETNELRQKILDALQGNEVEKVMDPTKYSRNYKIGSLEGNMVFDEANQLPKEAMLEMTLNAFGYDIDMFEVGMEGKGLEPTVEALFGSNGFFPDTVMKTIYFATDKIPSQLNEVLSNMIPALRNYRKKRQATQNIVREISQNVVKLIEDLKAQDTPEVMLYLRLLGAELGYVTTKDMEDLAYSVSKIVENFIRMFPSDFITGMFSSLDNELFLHYIFMDNEFYLPTGPGVPLRVALSGTFTPGVKGGLTFSRDMSEIAFMPSVGIEFVTEIGAHLPDYVQSGLKMHTNIYHESSLRAKVAISQNQIKLTIPAPEGPSRLIRIDNALLSVVGDNVKTVPAMKEHISDAVCGPFFPGLEKCSSFSYSEAMSNEDSPYFPLSGNSRFEIKLRPTGNVPEYTATMKYAHEGEFDKVIIEVKAEGTPTEATAILTFDRMKYAVSADLQVAEYLNVGLRVGPDLSTKTKGTHSIMIEFLNNRVPQASLVGLAKIDALKEAMLQGQLLVPSLQAVAKLTANLKRTEDLTLELESDLKFPVISSVQKIIVNYGDERIETEIKSNVISEIKNIVPDFDTIKAKISDRLDRYIGSDILTSSVKATNSYFESSKIPFVENIRVPDFPESVLPERLYCNVDVGAKYYFGKHYYTISLPLPLGGKTSKDLNFPPALTTPNLAVPQLGLEVASISVPLPEILVPETLTVSLPIFGKAEVSGTLSSNLYNIQGTASVGREQQSYSANVEVTGTSPVDILSFRVQGSTLLSGTTSHMLKAEMNTAINHKLIDATVSIAEEIKIAEEISIKSSSKFDAKSPIGAQVTLEHTGQVEINTEEISGDCNIKGSFVTGGVYGDVSFTQSNSLFPFRPEARIQSTLKVDSSLLQAQNNIVATFTNGELSVLSNTDAFGDRLAHTAEVKFMQSNFAVKSDIMGLALGLKIKNIAEASISAQDVYMKIETTTDHSEDYIRSLLTLTADGNGLALKSNASAKLAENTAIHKASLTLNKNGLATSGSTLLNSPLVLKNTFSGIIDFTKASLSVKTKGDFVGMDLAHDISMSATTSSLELTCKSKGTFAKDLSYQNDVFVHAEPYVATVNINNNVKILPVILVNEAVFKTAPYQADLTGELKLSLYAEELKHMYEIKYADLTATAKCSTTGKLMGAHMRHDTEMEIAGLGVRVSNNANFNSQPVRFTTNLQATAAPFSFSLNALANGDGELNLFGKQSAQVYTKLLMKAEPLALVHSHESRLSTKHELNSEVTVETNFDNKVDTVLTPSEQSATIRLKSKINNNEMTQDISAYNNQERIGLEVSGVLLNREIKDVSLSGFLKYDKNTESHAISLPFAESIPAILDKIRITVVTIAEALQSYIKGEDFVLKIQTLLQQIKDYVTDLNSKEWFLKLKNDLTELAQNCPIMVEDLEVSVMKLKTVAQEIVAELGIRASKVEKIVREMIVNGAPDVQKLTEKLNALIEEYDITEMLLTVIKAIEDVIKQIDVMKLKDSSIAFLYDVNEKFAIKDTIEQFLDELRAMVANFDKARFVENVKNFIISVNIQDYTESLLAQFPTEKMSKIANMLKLLITELDLAGKCKDICNKIRSILVHYEVDKKMQAFLDKTVELIKQFNIDQTVQISVNVLESIMFPFKHMFEEALIFLKTNEVKDIIKVLNMYLDVFIQSMKSFDYNTFVDEANQIIRDYTTGINKLIVSLELSKKLEAARKFINHILTSLTALSEELRTYKIRDVLNRFKDIIDDFAETFKQKIIDMDLRGQILQALEHMSYIYIKVLSVLTNAFNDIFDVARKILGNQPITEMRQIIEGVLTDLKTAELEFTSFIVPFTDLVLPSMKISLQQLQNIELPAQIELPQFTVLGFHTVSATTIRLDDIKQRLIELLDFIVNFEINAYFGELTVNFLPDFSAITLPEITIPEVSFPAISKLSDKYTLTIPLTIPEIKLPKIPNEVVLPAFGKLYSEIRFHSPIYTLRTSAEIHNSTDNEQRHQFTAFITSMGTSPVYPILNYNLDSTARIGIPRMSRLIIAETLKFIHNALIVEHQASVTFYGLSAQATAQTAVKANTTPYKADIINKAFFAVESGMTASLDTSYKHQVDIPFISYTDEAAVTQSVVAVQKDSTLKLTVVSVGTGKMALSDSSDEFTFKNNLTYTMNLNHAKLTLTETYDSSDLKMTETLNVNAVALSHIDFSYRLESKSSNIKNSLAVASGRAHLGDLRVEVEAKHDTELVGPVSGTLSNALNIMIRPVEILIDFQNKGNSKVSLEETLSAKIDLQNDYSIVVNTQNQRIYTAALVRFNQYKYGHNFKLENNKAETGVYAMVSGEIDLDFLDVPISIPEMIITVAEFKTPAIHEINLYEKTGIKHLLTSTKQALDFNGKIVYQKSMFSPIIDLGLISVPAIGNLSSEMSFKSSIFSINANAGIQGDDDLIVRIAATSTSVYESLKAKLEGTSSLTLKRGLKLANALSLDSAHISGNHESTMTLTTDNLQAAVAVNSFANVNLPILTIDTNHKLNADTKTIPNAASTLKVKYTFDIPIIKAVGSGDAEHTFKLEGTHSFISAESKANSKIDGTLLETGIMKGALDNEASIYINGEVLRSTLKTLGDVNVNYADLKVQFDVNENLELEAAPNRIYTVLSVASNNEVKVTAFSTKGKHAGKATIDLVPMVSLTSDVEFDLSQPSSFGDLTMYEKTVVDLTLAMQKISYTMEIASPVYTTSFVIHVDGNAPVFKAELKASSKSPIELLEYDLDSYISSSVENYVPSVTAKAFLEHKDFAMNLNSIVKLSEPSHTLNVDITSTTFTDAKLFYNYHGDGINVTVSTPSEGLLGFELYGKIPSKMYTRFYSRCVSIPEDNEMFTASIDTTDEKIHFQATYNLEAPSQLIMVLKTKMPDITSSIRNFAEKNGISDALKGLKETIVSVIDESFMIASTHAPELSQLSVLFRNVIVQYQKVIQTLLNAAAKFLRETQIELPGVEGTTLPEICKKIKGTVAEVIDQIVTAVSINLGAYLTPFVKAIGTVQFILPTGEEITGEQIFDYVENTLRSFLTITVNSLKQLESLDVVLEKLSDTLQEVVEMAQEFIDKIQSDVLDAVALYINQCYINMITLIKQLLEEADVLLTLDQFSAIVENCLETVAFVLSELSSTVYTILPENGLLVKAQCNSLEIDVPFYFQQ